jgi:hypothetical protein
MIDMRTIFSAEPKSTFALLSPPGLGFYVPAYQRPYSWGKENTIQLVEDVVRGVGMMRTGGEAITFLGTMILIQDIKYTTVDPQVKGELPTRVMLVIDGQQRIATLLLLNAVLHSEINSRIITITKKDKGKDKDRDKDKDFGLEWIRQRALQTRADLAMTLFLDMNYGEDQYRYYPRMIRAYDDSWSRRALEVRYQSPVARILHDYGIHARSEAKAFQPQFGDASGGNKTLAENWKAIRSKLRELAEGGKSEDMPEPYDIGAAAEEAMFQQPLPPEVVALARENDPEKERATGRELLRLVLFARYLLERAAVTEVVAKDDNYAFDIFEALNTSGEPLTAFDTFKPRVIKAETQPKYESSPSFKTMGVIEQYLDQYKRASDKHDATSRLLIPFAMSETGARLSKRLSDQRRYLRDAYDSFDNAGDVLEERRAFVQHLAYSAEFLQRAWPEDTEKQASLPEFDELDDSERRETLACLEILRSAKHTITIAPLARFYAHVKMADTTARKEAVQELAAAIRAVTAFLGIWRGPKTGTSNIDQQYRNLMSKGIDGGLAFARRPPDVAADVPTSDKLRTALRHALRAPAHVNVQTKSEWVTRTADQPLYEAGTVAKLLLFAATHDSESDPSGGGLISSAKKGTLDLFSIERWRELTLERIAPQKKSTAWESKLYDLDHKDRLGNLTLLPEWENSSVGNRSWAEKKLWYSVLSTPELGALKATLAEAEKRGLEVGKTAEELLKDARFHPQLTALASVAGEWTCELVEQRSIRLAGLAWDKLAPWLGITDENV